MSSAPEDETANVHLPSTVDANDVGRKIHPEKGMHTEEEGKGTKSTEYPNGGNDDDESKVEETTAEDPSDEKTSSAPPLPDEDVPPLPDEEPPAKDAEDDGWQAVWEPTAHAYYFFNRFTGVTQWTNPRVPEASASNAPPGTTGAPSATSSTDTALEPPPSSRPPAGGYNPAIHGDYDPNAWYAQEPAIEDDTTAAGSAASPTDMYAATGYFNRFTGKWQAADMNPERFSDENKSRRQMGAFFDVDAAMNTHDGRSLKAERAAKKLSKTELKQFKEKRKAKKEEKRRAWLRD